jgi:hypothetical protein
VNQENDNPIEGAKQAVTRLIEVCGKGGPLYQQHPKTVAQVNRTAKWLLNAIGRLQHDTRIAQNTAS